MIFSHILVPFDGSELSLKSLNKAIEFAKLNETIKISVLHVITFPVKRGPESLYSQVKGMIVEYGNETIEKASVILADIPNQFEVFVKEGSAQHTILQQAKELNCDLIIMGSRGLSGFKEFLGSVSHSISQHSTIPVLLIK
ncbi:nucleotide-binding universal stress UspA family protein [Cytobacillus eiseniae]|uniref:Nucleotide-binding universal stress UspA family protein n=1 Tax=Cytobacillus eiseniae TaxID=762947 RepID=A0ABS4RBC2_9BACI|nr:universal stress protein [Cytobacillus eiseniae]MBP2239639.1 nucleotide-binding universal stress UspA family protein [Cytobacillus eiseniae]